MTYASTRDLKREALLLLGDLAFTAEYRQRQPKPNGAPRTDPEQLVNRAYARWHRRSLAIEPADRRSEEVLSTAARPTFSLRFYPPEALHEALDYIRRSQAAQVGMAKLQLDLAQRRIERELINRKALPAAPWEPRGYAESVQVGYRAFMRNSRRKGA